ncbi:hypothetical protein ACFFJY_14910 [Fictibacillus aquaticus]|uniref:YhfM-like domain-containing protein n=1 Tax=Fictibacillus aquaticus TaxID=2021314 RepID=A0A235FET5_9BACL|nr:hypothetical protein [Fictibacillus aquaticus]OYD59503.1 hypothetical protein CGZ90_06325 [Fictibacillus aquaticus]
MRYKMFLVIAITSVFSLIIVFSNQNSVMLSKIKDHKITVQKHSGEGDSYEDFNEITEQKKVDKAIKIVKNNDWNKIKVEMSRYPDYRFQFSFKDDDNSEGKIASYSLWVNANGDHLQIVTDSGNYVKLDEKNSKILFEILTDKSK